jgi:hypothetical protein
MAAYPTLRPAKIWRNGFQHLFECIQTMYIPGTVTRLSYAWKWYLRTFTGYLVGRMREPSSEGQ